MFKIVKNSKGFSLVEVMIVAGLIGGLALMVMKVQEQSAKTARTFQSQMEITQLLHEIRQVISSKENCRKTFLNLNAKNSSDEEIKYLAYKNQAGNWKSKFKADNQTVYGDGIKIVRYLLNDSYSDVDIEENSTYLIVEFFRGKITSPPLVRKKIKLWVETDKNFKLKNCRALSAGNLTLEIVENDPLQECDEEGKIRYNSKIKGMEFCDGAVWKGVGATNAGTEIKMYQCPTVNPSASGTPGNWGFYGCQGQITSQTQCKTIEHPQVTNFSCTYVGTMVLRP
jgi:prepilin-type N-terminal cleavage/methylation domain-containing protein